MFPGSSIWLDLKLTNAMNRDEILFQAKIHPEQYTNSLSDAQLEQLHRSVLEICNIAVDTLADQSKFPENWLMKYRWGKGKKNDKLPTGEKIVFLDVGGRTSAVVPSVQKKTGSGAAETNSGSAAAEEQEEQQVEEKKPIDKRKQPARRKGGVAAKEEEADEEEASGAERLPKKRGSGRQAGSTAKKQKLTASDMPHVKPNVEKKTKKAKSSTASAVNGVEAVPPLRRSARAAGRVAS